MCYSRSMIADVDREIPSRELRNNISQILREVEAGHRIRVTVSGRPVADLVPLPRRRKWVPRPILEKILRESPLDQEFQRDIDAAIDDSIDKR